MRSSLFNLSNAPEKRHAVSKKGDIAFGHTMEPSSVSIVCNWPILSKNSFTSPSPGRVVLSVSAGMNSMIGLLPEGQQHSFNLENHVSPHHLLRSIDQCSDFNDLCTHLKVVADQHLMAEKRGLIYFLRNKSVPIFLVPFFCHFLSRIP